MQWTNFSVCLPPIGEKILLCELNNTQPVIGSLKYMIKIDDQNGYPGNGMTKEELIAKEIFWTYIPEFTKP